MLSPAAVAKGDSRLQMQNNEASKSGAEEVNKNESGRRVRGVKCVMEKGTIVSRGSNEQRKE